MIEPRFYVEVYDVNVASWIAVTAMTETPDTARRLFQAWMDNPPINIWPGNQRLVTVMLDVEYESL